MRKILLSLLAILGMATTYAQDYSKYYQNLPVQMSQPILPAIPANQVSILDCGGKGDGTTINTQAFSKAISQLSKKGGGHLNVPAGIYLTGLISLTLGEKCHHRILRGQERPHQDRRCHWQERGKSFNCHYSQQAQEYLHHWRRHH